MQKNKFVLLILCFLAALCIGACAEGTDPGAIQCEIVDGNYVIRIPAAENDLGWYAEEPAENAAVKLISAEMKDGCFVAQYAPAADGTATVSVRHAYCAAACDQALTWDLAVRDGRITESTGGSYTANPPEEEMDAAISGAWQEAETQFTALSIRKNENRGWDVEALSPMTHGAYVFKTTVYYDCAEDAFLYDKGKFFDLNTDGSIQSEARAAGTSGSFKFTLNDEQKFLLVWTDPEAPQSPVVFEKSAEALSMKDLANVEWTFSSGAGAWSTDMRIAEDGSFAGEYHDSDMGDATEAYPNGTVYTCAFTGQMTLEKQLDNSSWQVRVDRLTPEQAPEQETLADGMRFITAEPYGLSEGDTMILYAPGTPADVLTEDMRLWAHLDDRETAPDALENWFLYSEKNQSGFVGFVYEEPMTLANPWTEMTAEQLEQTAGITFGIPEGAQDLSYQWMAAENLAQMQFTIGSDEYCARVTPAAVAEGEALPDISGMYFGWENEQAVWIGGCRGTIGQFKTGSTEWVERCLWYDAAPGLMYSLSVYTTNPEGLDLIAAAEQVYQPVQGNN